MRETQLEWCRQCVNRRFEMKKGLVCNLTGKPADFDTECPDFFEDPEAMAELEDRKEWHDKIKATEDPLKLGGSGYNMIIVLGSLLGAACLAFSGYYYFGWGRLEAWSSIGALIGLAMVVGAIVQRNRRKKEGSGENLLDEGL